MLDPLIVEERFRGVMQNLTNHSNERSGLVRMVEFLEVLLETKSRELVREYAPTLVVRAAHILGQMKFTDMNVSLGDRLTPILWSLVIEYPEIGNSGVCLAMLQRLVATDNRDIWQIQGS